MNGSQRSKCYPTDGLTDASLFLSDSNCAQLQETRVRLGPYLSIVDIDTLVGQEDHLLYYIFYDAWYVSITNLARTLIKFVVF